MIKINKIEIKNIICKHFWDCFNVKTQNQIYYGGRNSTKSSYISIKIVYNCLLNKDCSAVVLRSNQVYLRKSVYHEIKRACARLGLIKNIDYNSQLSPMSIKFKNGNIIYFCGGEDYEALKGIISETSLIKMVWFEELTGFKDEETIRQIKSTFTRGNNDWFISFYSFNPPKNKYHWVNKFIESKQNNKDYLIRKSTFLTVPREWVGELAIKEAEELKKNDLKMYEWIYLGEVVGVDGLIFNYDFVEEVGEDYLEKNRIRILRFDISTDSGHLSSATSSIAIGYGSDSKNYLLDIYYYSPKDKSVKKSPSDLSKEIFNFKIKNCIKYKTNVNLEILDSAEGALRNQYFKDFGIRLKPVNKGKNKNELIDYTYNYLSKKNFRILNNKNNEIFKKELKNYSWKGKETPEPDKTEKKVESYENLFNTHSNSYITSYADHSVDAFQYWVKENLNILGLK